MSYVSVTECQRVEMTDAPWQEDQTSGHPQHTPEEEKTFGDRIRTLARYGYLTWEALRHAIKSRGWALYLGALFFVLLVAIVVLVAVFYSGSGEDQTDSLLGDTSSSLVDDSSGDQEMVSLTGQPWIFHASDQGIFTMYFQEDGTCSAPDWSHFVAGEYTESELHVELTLHRRLTEHGTVVDWDEWFFMDRTGDLMRGTWKVQGWEIDPDGTLTWKGISLMPHDIIARPK